MFRNFHFFTWLKLLVNFLTLRISADEEAKLVVSFFFFFATGLQLLLFEFLAIYSRLCLRDHAFSKKVCYEKRTSNSALPTMKSAMSSVCAPAFSIRPCITADTLYLLWAINLFSLIVSLTALARQCLSNVTAPPPTITWSFYEWIYTGLTEVPMRNLSFEILTIGRRLFSRCSRTLAFLPLITWWPF